MEEDDGGLVIRKGGMTKERGFPLRDRLRLWISALESSDGVSFFCFLLRL